MFAADLLHRLHSPKLVAALCFLQVTSWEDKIHLERPYMLELQKVQGHKSQRIAEHEGQTGHL